MEEFLTFLIENKTYTEVEKQELIQKFSKFLNEKSSRNSALSCFVISSEKHELSDYDFKLWDKLVFQLYDDSVQTCTCIEKVSVDGKLASTFVSDNCLAETSSHRNLDRYFKEKLLFMFPHELRNRLVPYENGLLFSLLDLTDFLLEDKACSDCEKYEVIDSCKYLYFKVQNRKYANLAGDSAPVAYWINEPKDSTYPLRGLNSCVTSHGGYGANLPDNDLGVRIKFRLLV